MNLTVDATQVSHQFLHLKCRNTIVLILLIDFLFDIKFCTAELVVYLEDYNDNAPVFDNATMENGVYDAKIMENARNDTVITTVKAVDRDKRQTITYSIIDGDSKFHVNPQSGRHYRKYKKYGDSVCPLWENGHKVGLTVSVELCHLWLSKW